PALSSRNFAPARRPGQAAEYPGPSAACVALGPGSRLTSEAGMTACAPLPRRASYARDTSKSSPRHTMTQVSLLLLPGDGIGVEVMAEVERIVAFFNKKGKVEFNTSTGLVGGSAIDKFGVPLHSETLAEAQTADAVVFGAVGGPKWDKVPYEIRPEAGLLRLRKDLDLFANLRPAVTYPALADASSLKRELVEGLDIMILRELTGGVYFGQP